MSCGWFSVSLTNVAVTLLSIFCSAGQVAGRFFQLFVLELVEQPTQKRAAPAAARPSRLAGGELRSSSRTFNAQEVRNFAARDVKTKAKFVVGLHKGRSFFVLWRSWRCGIIGARRSLGCGDTQGDLASGPEFTKLKRFADHVLIPLTASQAHRGNAAGAEPICIQAAVGNRQ